MSNRRTRALAVLAATSLAGCAALMLAPAAHAASWTANCAGTETEYFDLAFGETFTLTITGACLWVAPGVGDIGSSTYGATGTENVLTPDDWTAITPTITVIYSGPACGGTNTDALYTSSNANVEPATNLGTYGLTMTSPACVTPPDVLQQVQAGHDSTCTQAGDATHNIGGVSSGGWGRSWAQWINDGRGGAVCTRTLTWNNSTGAYVVAS